MNDFTEIENELKKLRPIEPSAELIRRLEAELVDRTQAEKIVTLPRFRINWLSLGAGLAAAAVLLMFVQVRLDRSGQPQPQTKFAATSPAQQPARLGESVPWRTRSTIVPAEFVPAGATQVVYRTEDEGLLFPTGSDQPVRRVRASMRETLRWQNRTTGASLRVSYPTEEVSLVPVYGQ
jgi:hypothetical protein